MRGSEKSPTGQAHGSHRRKDVFPERSVISWTSSSIGCTTRTLSALSFFLGRPAQESHPSHMRLRVVSPTCLVLRHPLSFYARSNRNVRHTTSLQLSLAISPTGIHHSRPRLARSSRITPPFASALGIIPRSFNPLFSSRSKNFTSSVLLLS